MHNKDSMLASSMGSTSTVSADLQLCGGEDWSLHDMEQSCGALRRSYDPRLVGERMQRADICQMSNSSAKSTRLHQDKMGKHRQALEMERPRAALVATFSCHSRRKRGL